MCSACNDDRAAAWGMYQIPQPFARSLNVFQEPGTGLALRAFPPYSFRRAV
jgi:hypothetical protein